MSWRELRNFTNAMQILGYPYQISLDAFRTPNFELMAHALIWLLKRYDPHFTPPAEDTGTEQDRIFFLRETCTFANSKLRIKLNPQNLYRADGYCVKELAKISKVLIDATTKKSEKTETQEEASPAKLVEPKNTRQLVSEIINDGVNLSDLLGQEKDLKIARLAAISLPMEVEHIERLLQEQITDLRADTTKLQEQLRQLDQDKGDLQAKIEKKKQELERARTRMKSWQNVKPVHMEEYDKLEAEVQNQYKLYVEKFRNVEWLEHELEQYTTREQQRIEEAERAIQKLQKRLRDQQAKQIDDEEEDGFNFRRPPAATQGQGPSEDDGSEDDQGSLSSYGRSEESQSGSDGDGFARGRFKAAGGRGEGGGDMEGSPEAPQRDRSGAHRRGRAPAPAAEPPSDPLERRVELRGRPGRGEPQPGAPRPGAGGRRQFDERGGEGEGEGDVLSDAEARF